MQLTMICWFQVYSIVIQRYMCIFFQIPFHRSLLKNTEYGSLCCTVGPCWYAIVYICQSQTLNFNHSLSPLVTISFFSSLWVYFYFVNELICIFFFFLVPHASGITFVFVLLNLLSMISKSIHVAASGIFFFFKAIIIVQLIYSVASFRCTQNESVIHIHNMLTL